MHSFEVVGFANTLHTLGLFLFVISLENGEESYNDCWFMSLTTVTAVSVCHWGLKSVIAVG